ncbi:hypothetical protein [Paraburkholderia sediminicola]|uniref:hypothetical protein n=1 Tax=Paraburkholderia sediminicola TaxID=458836 RepID=UPI0038B96CF0
MSEGIQNLHIPRHSPAQSTRVDGGRPGSHPHGASAAVPAELDASGASEKPAFTHAGEEMAWIESQVAERQDVLIERHAREIKALTNSVYDAAKKVGQDGAWDAARSADKLAMGMERKQRMEMANEGMRTRRQLGEFYGVQGPRPCIIMVHMLPGEQLVGGATAYGPNAIEVTDVVAKDVQ